jgi:choline kinase
MKIIILAAGRGERLMPLTKNTPKPLLDMGNGNTLLEEQLSRIAESGAISDVVIVAGYLAEQVEAKVSTQPHEGLDVRTLYNPFFEVSNNLMSLWLARSEMGEDFMVTNGDNLFSAKVFRRFAEETSDGIWLSVGKKEEFDHDDMRVSLTDGVVSRVSKKIPDPEADAESPGLGLVRGERARRIYVEQLDALAHQREHLQSFWLEVYNRAYTSGVTVKPWFFETEGNWQEVDFHQDVELVRAALKIRLE